MLSMRALLPRLVRSAAVALLAAFVPACSDSTGPGDPRATLDEVMREANDPLLDEIASRASVGLIAFASRTSGPFHAGCGYVAASESFVCPVITSDGMRLERSYILLDAAGNRQAAFSPTTTAAVRTTMHISGRSTEAGSDFTFDELDDRTVSGLLTSRHVLDGTSTMSMSGTMPAPGSTSAMMRGSQTTKIESLVLPSRDNRWPGPGTMTMDGMMAFGSYESPLHMRALFTGTRCVTITVGDGAWSDTFTIDLANPDAASCTP